MAKLAMKLMWIEVSIGILFLIYELLTGQPWANTGVPWTMDNNFHFTIALGFFVGAGYTFILGSVIGSIGKESHSKVK